MPRLMPGSQRITSQPISTDTHCIAGLSAVLTMPQSPFRTLMCRSFLSYSLFGCCPEEVEQGVCIRVEEELDGVEG